MYGCPVCNGFNTLVKSCDFCGDSMEDMGKLENFADPYSPYQDYEENMFPYSGDAYNHYIEECVHLASCLNCNSDHRVSVELVPS